MDPARHTHGFEWRKWERGDKDGGKRDAAVGADNGEYFHEPLGKEADSENVDVDDAADYEGADV